ncbi:hypothetical protein PNEG_02009 [Pneumocystis murina B123]|uniref:NADP-dependent L-serine/L-allo-threonine dehydrogenase ydfG n=1 Tax=Pneumocystis murina (strain B123) TaxID=1069680 RepID=M7NMD3_PNEMU|nr:hypothetical protein PNEG_02009 [Pneumocystis murina B123]EMR09828.1 hypothetical protein PNEG_02009 [Pneumocystis murina B123]
MSRLSNKTIFITGASSGIGKACAYEFAKTNNTVKLIISARRDVTEIAKDIESTFPGVKVLPLRLDVSKLEDIEEKIEGLPDSFKDIDILINNAGFVIGMERVGEINPGIMMDMFSTNVFGLINITQKILNIFHQKGGKGDIINIGSIAGREPYPNGSIYCATKAAVRSFTNSLRKELINTRIRVIEIDPGLVKTEFSIVRFCGDKSRADAVYQNMEPLTGEDVAEAIVFAASRRENVVIADTLIFPNCQASISHVYREK